MQAFDYKSLYSYRAPRSYREGLHIDFRGLISIVFVMYDYRALLYSLDDSVKISDLKSGEFEYDRDVSGVQEYLDKHNINAHIDGGQTYHYKTYQIASKPYIYYTIGDAQLISRPIVAIV
jgi:hypothetical protein